MVLNTFVSGLNQAVCTKTARSYMALCECLLWHRKQARAVQMLKRLGNLVVCNENKTFWLGVQFFASDIITGRLLGHLGANH